MAGRLVFFPYKLKKWKFSFNCPWKKLEKNERNYRIWPIGIIIYQEVANRVVILNENVMSMHKEAKSLTYYILCSIIVIQNMKYSAIRMY